MILFHSATNNMPQGNREINLIACIAQNGGIGKGKELLFYIKEDMERFRQLTIGNTIIMGRKTYDSLPHGALPNRRNIVISTQNLQLKDCWICHSLEDAIKLAERFNEKIFIIGGASIYKQAIALASRLYLTKVEKNRQEANIFFPNIHLEDWEIKEKTSLKCIDKKQNELLELSFITLEKK